MKNLRDLSEEDAKEIVSIIRPYDSRIKHKVIQNDRDYIVVRTDGYMAEEVWFCKNNSYPNSQIINIVYRKSEVDSDLIFLAYKKLEQLGYDVQGFIKNKIK